MLLAVAAASAACEDPWAKGTGLDAATSVFAYDRRADETSTALVLGTVAGAVVGDAWVDWRVSRTDGFALRALGSSAVAGGLTFAMTEWAKASQCRPRPYTYAGTSLDPSGDRRSFFSGHTATTAVASFSLATNLWFAGPRTATDAVLLYGGATVVTAAVGALRVEAGKHYLSDVLLGGAVGAGFGVLLPALTWSVTGPVSLDAQATPDTFALEVGGAW